ncbi:MAG: endolytic transglycosylase MltG [Sphingobium sp.]
MRRIGCIIILIGLLIAGGLTFNFVQGWTGRGPTATDVSFTVPEGASLTAAAVKLRREGIIRSADAFVLRAKLFAHGAEVKSGEYLIPAGASNREILKILSGGVGVNRFVTIPEGMPSIMVYERLMKVDGLTGVIPVPEEGSVLPDTYAYDKGDSRAKILARMTGAMSRTMKMLWPARSNDSVAKTPAEALTLASIVEKETAIGSERAMVAGVYSNRVRLHMMLQADPTIIYPITKGKPLGRRIRKSEIATVNDYNTYAMTGLPKGPIANPSRASIEAVLNPEKTAALYFVADGKGGHIFANTLEQHNENVRKWFEIRRQRGEL